jgi:hypothetical protein
MDAVLWAACGYTAAVIGFVFLLGAGSDRRK